MKIFRSISAIQAYLKPLLSTTSIGFVPTMGALHEGHLELVRQAKQNNDIVVASIFVNPTQFNNSNDFAKYPRTEEQDIALLINVGCDVLFIPETSEMYPAKALTTLNFGNLETVMEGKFRAGHFNGVGLVVAKLFHIIKPTQAYFGQKDLQQCLVIKQLIRDYSFDIQLFIMPTIREKDGLAMSSRNRRLTPEQRVIAPKIYEGLQMAAHLVKNHKSIAVIKESFSDFIQQIPQLNLEYFEVADTMTLASLESISYGEEIALCTAVFMGDIRLIDNLIVEG